MKDPNKPSQQNIGNTGEYFIASILSSHNFISTITLRRAERYEKTNRKR